MQDPKFRPTDAGFWHEQGGYLIPPDEPLIVFRGKDLFTPPTLRHYITLANQEATFCQSAGEPELARLAREHADSVTERLETILGWQVANPQRCGLGCHTCALSGTQERLRHSTSH